MLRSIEMQPLAGDKAEDCYKNQVQIIKTLKTCMLIAKDVTQVAITVVKDINKNPKPLDLIVLLLMFSGTTRQKNAEALLKQNIRSGFYRISLLHTLYNDYKQVLYFHLRKKCALVYYTNLYMCVLPGCSRITTVNVATSG